MPELLAAFHAVGDGIALFVGVVLAWAAFFFVGPVLCAVFVMLRASGADVPADAELLFGGTAAAWMLALAVGVVTRWVRGAWRSMREAQLAQAQRRGRAAAEDIRAGRRVDPGLRWGRPTAGARRPSPFAFSFRDPWVAWAAAEAERIRRESAAQARAGRGHSTAGSGGAPPPGSQARTAPPPRAPEPDPHSVLGVPRGATPDAIRKAYRELVKKHHPDKVTDRSAAVRKAAHQRILEIRRAYDTLKEPRRG